MYHPDKQARKSDEETMIANKLMVELNHVNEILTDFKKRTEYDRDPFA